MKKLREAKEKLLTDKAKVTERLAADKQKFLAKEIGKAEFRETIEWANNRIVKLNRKFLTFRERTRKTYQLIKKRNAKRDASRKAEMAKTKAKALKLLKEVQEAAMRQDELIKRQIAERRKQEQKEEAEFEQAVEENAQTFEESVVQEAAEEFQLSFSSEDEL